MSVQFSSVLWPIGSSGVMTDDSPEILFQSFLREAIVSSSGISKDVHCLTLSIKHLLYRSRRRPPSKVPSWDIWEAVVACGIARPCKFPTLNSCQWTRVACKINLNVTCNVLIRNVLNNYGDYCFFTCLDQFYWDVVNSSWLPFLQWLYCSLHFCVCVKDELVFLCVCLGTVQYSWISTGLVIAEFRAVFCQSVQYLSFFCKAFSWTVLNSSSFVGVVH